MGSLCFRLSVLSYLRLVMMKEQACYSLVCDCAGYSYDEYVWASVALYLDIINLFIYLMRILNHRKSHTVLLLYS